MALRIKGRPLAVYYRSYRANPFIIPPPLTNSVNIYPLKKVRSKCRHNSPLKNERIFPIPQQKKTNPPPNPSEKAAKIKVCGHINLSETTLQKISSTGWVGKRSVYKMEWPITYFHGLLSEFYGILRFPGVSMACLNRENSECSVGKNPQVLSFRRTTPL